MTIRKTFEQSVRLALKPGSREPYFNNAGELNAGSNADAMAVLARMMSDIASGRVHMDTPDQVQKQEDRRQLLKDVSAAWRDKQSGQWSDLGAAIAAEITEVLSRQGLMRKVYAPGDLEQGETPRIRVRTKNVVAQVTTGIGAVAAQYVRDRFVEPAEFYVSASPRVTEIDINQGAADLLEDVYLRALEAMLTGEDRVWYAAAMAASGVANDYMALSGGLTPTNLTTLRQNVTRWNLSAERLILGSEAGNAFLNNSSGFAAVFGPVVQHEAIMTGKIGVLYGMDVITDGFRDPNQTVLGSRDVIITSAPVNHGAYTERNGGVVSQPVDEAINGIPARGWYLYILESQALVNPRSISVGTVV